MVSHGSHANEAVRLARERLSQLPPVTLTAKLLELYESIELQLTRGRKIQAIVDDLNGAGIAVSITVFKSTLYRLRKKQNGRTGMAGSSPMSPAAQSTNAVPPNRPPLYCPPTENTFK